MRIIAKATLRNYWLAHPQAEHALLDWYYTASDAVWKTPQDVKRTYGNASIVANNRVVFNIKGNDFRLVTEVDWIISFNSCLSSGWVPIPNMMPSMRDLSSTKSRSNMNLKDEANYQRAIDRIWHLMQLRPQPGTSEGDELDMLATLVEAYEEIHVPMQPTDPVEFLNYKIQMGNLQEKDLVPYIGDEREVSNVLNHRRELTVGMVQRLSRGLKIPINLLIPAA